LVREKVPLVHAVLYTHYHADHLFGLDDVRLFPARLGGPLPLYCSDEVEGVIRTVFGYAFHPGATDLPPGVVPKLTFERVTADPFEVLGQRVVPIPCSTAGSR
jgi:phosphoribosyl 1,2-cyclic phosphate phosphodiesterase